MTTSLLEWCAVMVAAACLAGVALFRLRLTRARRVELASRPEDLADANLVYMEERFRARRPIPLVARIDRAYRVADGAIVLVELKTRWKSRAYATDVIQLSVQKMVIEGQTGQRVATHAFVTVREPTGTDAGRSHRIELLERSEVVALYQRRQDIIAGKVAPRYAGSSKACRDCAFRERCDRPGR